MRKVHRGWGKQGLGRERGANEINDRESSASGEVVAEGVLGSVP